MSDVKLSVVSGSCVDGEVLVLTSAEKPEEEKRDIVGPTDDELAKLAKGMFPEDQHGLIPDLIQKQTVRKRLVELWNKNQQTKAEAEKDEYEKKLAQAEAFLAGKVEHQLIELGADQRQAKKDVDAAKKKAQYESEQARKARLDTEAAIKAATAAEARAEAEKITRECIIRDFGEDALPPTRAWESQKIGYALFMLVCSVPAEKKPEVEQSAVESAKEPAEKPEAKRPSEEFLQYRKGILALRRNTLGATGRVLKHVHKTKQEEVNVGGKKKLHFKVEFESRSDYWDCYNYVDELVRTGQKGFGKYMDLLDVRYTEEEYLERKEQLKAEEEEKAEREREKAAEAEAVEAFKWDVEALLTRVGLDPTIAAGLIKRANGKIVNTKEITPAGVLRRRAMRDGRDEGVTEEEDRLFRIKLMAAVKLALLSNETAVGAMESATEQAAAEVDEILGQMAKKVKEVATAQSATAAARQAAIPMVGKTKPKKGGKKGNKK